MAHARKQIRDAIATALTGLATTGGNVFVNRLTRIQTSELPCLLIYGDTESVEYSSMGLSVNQKRIYEIIIQGVAQTVTTIETTLDQIGLEVENALAGTLPATIDDFYLSAVKIIMDQDGEKPTGNIQMTYNAEYYVDQTDPETIL